MPQTQHPFPAEATGEGNGTCFDVALLPSPQGTKQETMKLWFTKPGWITTLQVRVPMGWDVLAPATFLLHV